MSPFYTHEHWQRQRSFSGELTMSKVRCREVYSYAEKNEQWVGFFALIYGSDVLTELMIMAIPIWFLFGMRLSTKEKIGVASLFCNTLFTIAAATARCSLALAKFPERELDSPWQTLFGQSCSLLDALSRSTVLICP